MCIFRDDKQTNRSNKIVNDYSLSYTLATLVIE